MYGYSEGSGIGEIRIVELIGSIGNVCPGITVVSGRLPMDDVAKESTECECAIVVVSTNSVGAIERPRRRVLMNGDHHGIGRIVTDTIGDGPNELIVAGYKTSNG